MPLVLVRKETTPEDLRGMKAALGILTAVGGVSSHAALVSRQMGKVCIVGAGEVEIDNVTGTVTVKGNVLKEGDDISIDGFTGEVFAGTIATKPSEVVEVLIHKTMAPEKSDALPPLQTGDGLVRCPSQAGRAHQRRLARPGGRGDRLRCRGHRPVPHRAHVLRPHHRDARDDHGRRHVTTREGAGQDAAVPAQGLCRPVQGDGRQTGDDPPARSAAARVPAAETTGQAEMAKILGKKVEVIAGACTNCTNRIRCWAIRGCRLGIVYPGNHRHAGPGHLRGGGDGAEGGH